MAMMSCIVSKCIQIGYASSNNESMNVLGSFIRVDRLQIQHVSYNVVLVRYSIAAQNVSG